jgi:hypothetical protein
MPSGKDLPDLGQTIQWLCMGFGMRKTTLVMTVAAGALATGLGQSPAFADAREDVVAGLTRCANLTDDRQWLDCYYGAAQPMRAWLGLSPAPQSQLKLLQTQPQSAAIPTTVSRAATRSGPPPMPKHSGILDMFGGDDVINNTPIKSYEIGQAGFTVTLPDGQVWQQTDDDATKNPARWRQPATTMRVTIRQGAMHSFNLVLNDENQHYKVKRIR